MYSVVARDRAGLVEVLKTWTRVGADLTTAAVRQAGELTLTFGFGPSLFTTDRFGIAERRPAPLTPLPAFPGEAIDPGASHGDLCVQACATSPGIAHSAVRALLNATRAHVSLRWRQVGFRFEEPATGSPGLMGFQDGTANLEVRDPTLTATHHGRRPDLHLLPARPRKQFVAIQRKPDSVAPQAVADRQSWWDVTEMADPCRTVTQAEAAAAVGNQVGAGRRVDSWPPLCAFQIPGLPGEYLYISDDSRPTGKDDFDRQRSNSATTAPVSGISDQAYWQSEVTALHVLHGATHIMVKFGVRSRPPTRRPLPWHWPGSRCPGQRDEAGGQGCRQRPTTRQGRPAELQPMLHARRS